MGGDADETWYASLPEPEYSHNWMHLLATIDLPEKRGTHMVKDEGDSGGTIVPLRMIKLVEQAHQEVQEREIKEKSKRMTLYKGTLEDEDLGDEEPQVEPARIPLTLKITEGATFGLESLIDPGVSHNFISFEAWQTLPKGSMVPTNAIVTAINGT